MRHFDRRCSTKALLKNEVPSSDSRPQDEADIQALEVPSTTGQTAELRSRHREYPDHHGHSRSVRRAVDFIDLPDGPAVATAIQVAQ
jgi:hypothetical protein